jgi:AcrR family transcriptional regulator
MILSFDAQSPAGTDIGHSTEFGRSTELRYDWDRRQGFHLLLTEPAARLDLGRSTELSMAWALRRAERAEMGRNSAKADTSRVVLEAAKKMLRQKGYARLSTRDVAAAAGVPLSQIHYHFGSKQGMVLALFEHLNSQLLHRQDAMFHDPTLTLSRQWELACDYLDEDIASGYVRVLQELIAASWSDSAVAKVIQAGLMDWFKLLVELARRAEREFGGLGPFTADEVATLVGSAFIGAESEHLLGFEKKGIPIRKSLRRFGDLIRMMEAVHRK